jgi:hypothetical protein
MPPLLLPLPRLLLHPYRGHGRPGGGVVVLTWWVRVRLCACAHPPPPRRQIVGPRVLQGLMQAVGDWGAYALARSFFGPRTAAWAVRTPAYPSPPKCCPGTASASHAALFSVGAWVRGWCIGGGGGRA